MSIIYAILDLADQHIALHNLMQGRYNPNRIPQGAIIPSAFYKRIDSIPISSHQGYSGSTTTRLQFTFWAKTFDQSEAIGTAFFDCFQDRVAVVRGYKIARINLLPMPGLNDSATELHVSTFDMMIQHTQ